MLPDRHLVCMMKTAMLHDLHYAPKETVLKVINKFEEEELKIFFKIIFIACILELEGIKKTRRWIESITYAPERASLRLLMQNIIERKKLDNF